MSGRRQGVRSSRTGPVTKRDRDKLRKLDRKIGLLDKEIPVLSILSRSMTLTFHKRHALAVEKRDKLDQQRKELRHWMKGVNTGGSNG